MVGVGRTVFEGTELKDFKVHILGVLRNVQGPRRDLILARLEGAGLAESGVAQGMSGSPVYIDGQLVGAVSYSIGSFSKEPIAGITPIAEMKEATPLPRRAGTGQARLELPITREGLAAALAAASARLAPFARRPADVQSIGIAASAGGQLGSMLRPISTPLILGGFEPETVDLVSGAFRDAGFTPMVSGMRLGARLPATYGPLREGDAIGVALASGDIDMGATGTVTHIDGDRVYAFGHPFYNLGPAAVPDDARLRLHDPAEPPDVLQDLVDGRHHRDDDTGSADGHRRHARQRPGARAHDGHARALGGGHTCRWRARTRSAPSSTRLVNDQMFTPLIAYVAMFNTLASYERQFGASTIGVKSRARIKGHAALNVEDVFTGDSPILGAATAVAGPMTMLLGNDIEPITLEGLDVTITSAETPRRVTIERVWLDDIRPRAGRTTPLKILTRSYRGEETDLDRSDRDSSERLGPPLDSRQRRPSAERPRAARRPSHAGTTDGHPAGAAAERHPPQQSRLHPAAERHTRRRRQRRGHGGAAAVGAVGARKRSQRRQLHADAQRHRRGMGTAHGLGGHRVASPHHRSRQRFRPLMPPAVHSRPSQPMRTGVRFCIVLALVAATWTGLGAAMPTFWTVATQVDFLKGDVEDLSIDSDGRVFLGPSTSLVAETAAPFLWTVVPGADGSFWAGTGNEGKVLKIGKDGKVATFFDATELEVHAIVPAPNNALYVATSPDGKIYHVSADGTARTFFDPEDKYIWALALDRTGNLFAATGDKGVIYKITPDGKGARFYKTSSTNVVSLAFSPTGDLLAGTESPGRVFRIDATGKAFVLLDSPFKEIHSLRLADDGTLYAAAVSGSTAVTEDRSLPTPGADPGRAPVPTVSTEITAISVVDTGASQLSAPVMSGASRRSNRGAVYRIRPNGLWDTYWETGEDSPYDLLVEPGGAFSSAPAPKARSSVSPAIPRAPRCSRAPPRGKSRRSCANRPGASSARRATRGRSSRCRRTRRRRAATNRTCAMPAPWRAGVRSGGARRPGLGRCSC